MSSYHEVIEDPERPRGILSKRDRQFLLDEDYRSDLAEQSQRNTRARIRERIRAALLDFYILDENLDDHDRDLAVSEIDEPLRESLHSTMAFLMRVADENPSTLARWIEGGLTHIELEQRSRLLIDEPTVEIDIIPAQSVDPEVADEKIEAGDIEELSPAELRYMLWRVGLYFGNRDSEALFAKVLGEYVERFENETFIGDVKEEISNQ